MKAEPADAVPAHAPVQGGADRGVGQREDSAAGRGLAAHAVVEVPVAVRRLDPELPLPSYAHPGDAGADLYAAEDVVLAPGERKLVRTGVAIELPVGFVGLVHPRSGLAARHGLTVLNAPGTVDAGYRGEILVNLINHDPTSVAKIVRGDRIAQLVVQRVERARFHAVASLSDSARGAGGHGSTGVGLIRQPGRGDHAGDSRDSQASDSHAGDGHRSDGPASDSHAGDGQARGGHASGGHAGDAAGRAGGGAQVTAGGVGDEPAGN